MSQAQKQKRYLRFSAFERVEHLVLIISFTTLAVTGLVQKYSSWPVSQVIVQFLGGIETTRLIHHFAAALFLIEAVYHLIMAGYKIFVQNKEASMLPGIKDGLDALQWFRYNLGMAEKPPKMPRYNFMEKAEYWAMAWGLVLMGLTGLMLWNPIATTNILPGTFIPAAKAAHGAEAVLAVLAIILWHFYHVHIKHWNWAMIKGTISRHEMEVEHADELEKIELGRLPEPPPPAEARRRLAIFAPAAAVISLALLGSTFYFLTFEKTAITTIPAAEEVQVFAPQTPTPVPPTPTPAPLVPTAVGQPTSSNELVWVNGIEGMLKGKCIACHNDPDKFYAETYKGVMRGVLAGYPDTSPIVQVQVSGAHPVQLTDEEIAMLRDWIKAGAHEVPGENVTTGPGTWAAGMQTLFKARCGACHGESGGFNVSTYNNVILEIKPGDVENSSVIQVQKSGDHPGMFTPDELQQVSDWIQAGAPDH